MSMNVKVGHNDHGLADGIRDLPKNMTDAGKLSSVDGNSDYASISKGVTVDQSFRKQIEDSRFNRTTGKKFLESTHHHENSDLGSERREERAFESIELLQNQRTEHQNELKTWYMHNPTDVDPRTMMLNQSFG